jgi:hypothetical protein
LVVLLVALIVVTAIGTGGAALVAIPILASYVIAGITLCVGMPCGLMYILDWWREEDSPEATTQVAAQKQKQPFLIDQEVIDGSE